MTFHQCNFVEEFSDCDVTLVGAYVFLAQNRHNFLDLKNLKKWCHTEQNADPNLILCVRITKPLWPPTVPPTLFSLGDFVIMTQSYPLSDKITLAPS